MFYSRRTVRPAHIIDSTCKESRLCTTAALLALFILPVHALAALDLDDPSPVWATVIDRLRAASGVEGALGRARAALVYALASSGAVRASKTTLGSASMRILCSI